MRYRKYQAFDDTQKTYLETIADCLPRRALVATRPDIASVDKHNFVEWVKHFVEDVKDLTVNGKKVLLIYDGFRSHMCIEALEILKLNGIIAYALPAHTSGTKQPLHASCFGPWKAYYRFHISVVLNGKNVLDSPLNEFDV